MTDAIRTAKFPNKASLRNNGDGALEYIERLKRHIYFSDKKLAKERRRRKGYNAELNWHKHVQKDLNEVINLDADWLEDYKKYLRWSVFGIFALGVSNLLMYFG